ncbi:N-methyltryptophan oxidase [mine drainage metagenome]|jgi:predicted Rossmann fold flavoprotein|uniref:N-methyltryptophan oxidase n=1 Tax=mine drainage metagenome TaxID=410659 RepID=A0A1J5R2M9_9ZZZZ
MIETCDVAVIGAGAAGMMCAGVAAQRGRRVVLIDHARRIGEKIRISGGGRCNFTNIGADIEHYHGRHAQFARTALRGYAPRDFIALVRRHRVAFHEKHRGQLFCDDSSQRIIDLLRAECAGVHWRQPCRVHAVRRDGGAGFALDTDHGALRAGRVVVATGGLPVAQIGASDWGLRLARQFGLDVVAPQPALVPLRFDSAAWAPWAALAGVSMPARVRCGEQAFDEDLLFTHRGLSGPAILQISSFWDSGRELQLDLAPASDLGAELRRIKSGSRATLLGALAQALPRRLAQAWIAQHGLDAQTRLAECADTRLRELGAALQAWTLTPTGSEGWRKAEVMRGGVATEELDPRTLQAHKVPGLHFIGEVVDVTGWLGGYNFQWAWASAVAAARSL